MERKLAALLSADVQGYSRLMSDDEEATIRTITEYRALLMAFIHQQHGRVVDSPGDNLLAEFSSALDAVQAAVTIQTELKIRNDALPDHRRMAYRIGINVGDVVVEGDRIYGDSVNIAARLESLADGGGICISGTVFDHIENKLDLGYDYLGEQEVKNISKPIRLYRVQLETEAKPARQQGIEATTQPPVPPDKPSIAVLPFTNMSPDPEQEYFSDGITEDLITDLSKLSGLLVIARNSVFTYKGQAVKVDTVGRELGVRYVLEGSVRKAGSRLRITAQLVEAATGQHLWAERYDRELQDIFALQDEVTHQIVSALEVRITRSEQECFCRAQTDSVDAYEYFLRGLEYNANRTPETNSRARKMFQNAIALDPQFAAAYAWLGRTHIVAMMFQWAEAAPSLQQAFALATKAVDLDDTLPTAHEALAYVYLGRQQFAQAVAEAEKATRLDPNNADALVTLAEIYSCVGRPEEAIPLVEHAMRLNPHYPASYLVALGLAYSDAERYEEAIPVLKRVLTRNADHQTAHSMLAGIYMHLGREEEGRAAAAEVMRINPTFSLAGARQAWPMKDQQQLEKILAVLHKAGLE